jgi:ribose-phosphate pyrophosphokinase
VAEVMNLIGDVRGKVGVLLDDMVDTAGTLTQGAKALMDQGAKRVLAYAVHPVLSGPAIKRISESVIEQLVVTNTIPLSPAARDCKKIVQLSVGRIFGEAIRRIYSADSLSSLFV